MTAIVRLWKITLLLTLKYIPGAISHSRKILSKDKTSTGLCKNLYFSDSVVELKHNKTPLLSSGRKLIKGSCLEISIIDPKV